jgi:hypothetical protein
MSMTDEVYTKFAQERSHQDAKNSAEFGKALVQIVIGINGLAATALITLASASKESALTYTKTFFLPLVLYLFGVASGAFVTLFYYQSSHHWATRWEMRARGGKRERADEEEESGKRYRHRGMICVFLSLAFFILGGLAASWALWHGPMSG